MTYSRNKLCYLVVVLFSSGSCNNRKQLEKNTSLDCKNNCWNRQASMVTPKIPSYIKCSNFLQIKLEPNSIWISFTQAKVPFIQLMKTFN